MPATEAPAQGPALLPLFPLQAVLFPEGLLGLKVFEARYLDLVSQCLRTQQPFGVVCLRQGREVGTAEEIELEAVGVLAHVDEVDGEQAGILRVRCRGAQRFRLRRKPVRQDNGLWCAKVAAVEPDPPCLPDAGMFGTVQALSKAIAALRQQGSQPFAEPYRLDDAGWVANRWCELLPVPLAAKQKLMELDDPAARLKLVDGFLREKKVVG